MCLFHSISMARILISVSMFDGVCIQATRCTRNHHSVSMVGIMPLISLSNSISVWATERRVQSQRGAWPSTRHRPNQIVYHIHMMRPQSFSDETSSLHRRLPAHTHATDTQPYSPFLASHSTHPDSRSLQFFPRGHAETHVQPVGATNVRLRLSAAEPRLRKT